MGTHTHFRRIYRIVSARASKVKPLSRNLLSRDIASFRYRIVSYLRFTRMRYLTYKRLKEITRKRQVVAIPYQSMNHRGAIA